MSVRLYVGNLPTELDRQALEQLFQDSGVLKVINDRKTGKCRGFAFITVETDEQAGAVIEKFNGFDFNGNPLKLEVALPRNKDAKADGKAEETDNPTESTPKPVRAVPKPALKSNRSRVEALSEIKLASDLPTPSSEDNKAIEASHNSQDSIVSTPIPKDKNEPKSESSKRRNKSRKQSNNKSQQSSFSYADTADQHQPDPRWAQELAQLRQRLLDAQAVK